MVNGRLSFEGDLAHARLGACLITAFFLWRLQRTHAQPLASKRFMVTFCACFRTERRQIRVYPEIGEAQNEVLRRYFGQEIFRVVVLI